MFIVIWLIIPHPYEDGGVSFEVLENNSERTSWTRNSWWQYDTGLGRGYYYHFYTWNLVGDIHSFKRRNSIWKNFIKNL